MDKTTLIKLKSLLFASYISMIVQTSNAQTQIGADIVSNYSYTISMPDKNTIATGWFNNVPTDPISGQVRIYTLKNNLWTQKGLTIEGKESGDGFGEAICMPDENTIAIGASRQYTTNRVDGGQVKIYSYTNNKWTQKGDNISGDSGDGFGSTLCMPDENTIAIGASGWHKNDTWGQVRILNLINNKWIQKGNNINGTGGGVVSMPNANTIAIGDYFGAGTNGIVRVFKFDGNLWVQKGQYIAGDVAGWSLGASLSMPDENTLGIGAPKFSTQSGECGLVSVFKWNGIDWTQKGAAILGTKVSGIQYADGTGFNVSMPDANTIAVGSYDYSIEKPIYKGTLGRVRIFKWTKNSWVQKGVDIVGDLDGDLLGTTISMPDNSTIAIGARAGLGGRDSYVRAFDLSSLGVGAMDMSNLISFYPNPAQNVINVKVLNKLIGSPYSVYDISGKVVLSGKIVSEITRIELGDLSAGLYTFKLPENVNQTFKVIKK